MWLSIIISNVPSASECVKQIMHVARPNAVNHHVIQPFGEDF